MTIPGLYPGPGVYPGPGLCQYNLPWPPACIRDPAFMRDPACFEVLRYTLTTNESNHIQCLAADTGTIPQLLIDLLPTLLDADCTGTDEFVYSKEQDLSYHLR